MKKSGYAFLVTAILPAGLFFAFACGGGGGGGPAVALFSDTNYVDYNENSNDAGASNVMKTLEHLGIDAQAFTGISATAFGSALSGKDVLAFPEITPTHYLAPNLSAQAVSVIHDFVEGGGTLLLFSGEDIDAAIANTAFGWDLEMGHEVYQNIFIDPGETAGTVFEGGPSPLSYPDQVTSYGTEGMPAGTMAMYADSEGYSCVTIIPYGEGQVIHLGWDWDWGDWPFPSTPITEGQATGWFEVLSRALEY